MNENSKRQLLAYSREVLSTSINGLPRPEFKGDAHEADMRLGAFVTLKKFGELRGCIGHISQDTLLKSVIRDMTVHAAFLDPRFDVITRDELDSITIEISVLTPFEPVLSTGEIEIGRDGLMLTVGRRSGLLLPQVPVEWGWDVNEFLAHLCMKAGLTPGAHRRSDAKLERFSAIVFGEDDFSNPENS